MAEQLTVEECLRDLPFLVASLVEKTTSQGSYDREIGRAVVDSVQRKVDWCVERLRLLGKEC